MERERGHTWGGGSSSPAFITSAAKNTCTPPPPPPSRPKQAPHTCSSVVLPSAALLSASLGRFLRRKPTAEPSRLQGKDGRAGMCEDSGGAGSCGKLQEAAGSSLAALHA